MTPANTAGSNGLVAYKLERISCAAVMARSEPAAAPPNAGARPSRSIRCRTCSRCAPSASRNTDLRAALRHQVCEHAEQTHGSKQQRYAREGRQQCCFEICVERKLVDDLIHRKHVRGGEFAIHLLD